MLLFLGYVVFSFFFSYGIHKTFKSQYVNTDFPTVVALAVLWPVLIVGGWFWLVWGTLVHIVNLIFCRRQ